jgi:predicted dehydrogenase
VSKIPKDMSFEEASTVTLGSIALQGVRRADLRVGEYCVVFGTGILGLLTVQILRTSGVRVVAIDFDDSRLKIAKEFGAELTLNQSNTDVVKEVDNWSGGYGADTVIVTASTQDNEPLSQSFQMCRKKGTVVLVGAVGMNVKREDIYKKELDFKISTSYGPGRYDKEYEIEGTDYPYAYVRWTENRNMVEYLRLVYTKQIKLDKLINKVYDIVDVSDAYESLTSLEPRPLMVILKYDIGKKLEDERKVATSTNIITNNSKKIIRVALVGCGSFAVNMHLPNFKRLKDKYALHAIVDRKGANARNIASQYGAKYATTDIKEVLKDDDVDLVVITTRHDSHASLTLQALEAGKNVFVEKPLATNSDDLEKIVEFYSDRTTDKPLLFVGFNRRFSKYSKEIKKHTDSRINPLFIRYSINAGYIPLDHWIHDHGGRIVGEACHIIDLMTYLTSSQIESITCQALSPQNETYSSSDNMSFALKYADGSICAIDYFSVGNSKYSKELMEIHYDGKSIIMNDFINIEGFGVRIKNLKSKSSQKGQFEELLSLYNSITGRIETWPIGLEDIVQTTKAALLIK